MLAAYDSCAINGSLWPFTFFFTRFWEFIRKFAVSDYTFS